MLIPRFRETMSSQNATRFQRTRADHRMEQIEDYVELINQQIKEFGEARVAKLAHHFGVSQVTVSKMVKRLVIQGFVEAQPYGPITLTPSGQSLAIESEQRHIIVADFLRAIGVPHDIAETDAEGIEHHVSRITLEAMMAFLSRP